MSSTEYLDKLYQGTFAAVYDALADLVRKDPPQAMHHIRQVLKSLYIQQGNDWSGRGVVGDTSIDASIAAHEAILAQLGSDAARRRDSSAGSPGSGIARDRAARGQAAAKAVG